VTGGKPVRTTKAAVPPEPDRRDYGTNSTRAVEMLDAELAAANDKITAAHKERDAAKADAASARGKLAEALNVGDGLRAELSKASGKAAELSRSLGEKTRFLETAEAALATARKSNDALRADADTAAGDSRHHRDQRDTALAKLEEARDETALVRDLLDKARAETAAARKDNEALIVKVTNLQRDLAASDVALHEHREARKALKADITKDRDDARAAAVKAAADLAAARFPRRHLVARHAEARGRHHALDHIVKDLP
jgi:chromosome segregation ATPase